MQQIILREGKKEDLPQVLELIKELAEYENALDQVVNTVEQMEIDGFGDRPAYGLFVAEKNNAIVGMALYYFRYSTWKGKRMYLEDIVVTQKERRQGIGGQLFDRMIEKSKEEQCTGLMWQVLDWNEPAISFYRRYDAHFDGEWVNCHIDF
jgi:GNAT superfamily N-acetyltransferase